MQTINTLLNTAVRTVSLSATAFVLSVSMMNLAAADVATKYKDSCAACHDSGALNAIKKGDTAKWQQLKQQKSMPALIDSVKNGMTQMPAGGLCNNCSDEEYRQLIDYMTK